MLFLNEEYDPDYMHYQVLPLYIRAKVLNNPESQNQMAKLYLDGDVLKEDHDEAVRWLKMAVRNDHTGSMVLLADTHDSGPNKSERETETLNLYRLAALRGMPYAQYRYGMFCIQGIGRPANEKMARKWLTRSAEQGYQPACEVLEELSGETQE